MKNFLNRFLRDESGATAIEYGLIAGIMAVAVITEAMGERRCVAPSSLVITDGAPHATAE